MKRIFLTLFLLVICLTASAQLKFTWETVPMDSTWDDIKDPAATQVLESYSDALSSLLEIIGYSTDEFSKKKPESGLSNFAVDAILQIAREKCNPKVDLAMTNFGGIRADLPKGAVRVYDIYSIFPFDNYIVLCDVKGSDLIKFFNDCLETNNVFAFGNVKIAVKGNTLEKCDIGGKKIDPERTYTMATINFLMEGGDMNPINKYAKNIVNTDTVIRDGMVDYIKSLTAKGQKLDLKTDGRCVITK